MSAWGAAIFSDDLADDVRNDWREAILEGLSAEEATTKLISETKRDQDEETVFWLALAAAQTETGRLQSSVRDRALEIIASGSDLKRWRELEASEKSIQKRMETLDRLAEKLKGPQPKPKRLRRPKPRGLPPRPIGEVIKLTTTDGQRQALIVVIGHYEAYPKGSYDTVVELLPWVGGELHSPDELASMPAASKLIHLDPEYPEDLFATPSFEIVATGIERKPPEKLTGTGTHSTSWRNLVRSEAKFSCAPAGDFAYQLLKEKAEAYRGQ